MQQYLIITLITGIAGLVQGITGFGSGIVMMMVLPMYYAVIQAAGISNAISVFLNGMMAIRYRKHINIKKAIQPSILFLCASTISTYFATYVNQDLIKKEFGLFLIILAFYFIFFNKSKRSLNLIGSICCVVISGICNGLFGIGGPLMVVYFLNQIHDTEEYLGTIQTFFFIDNLIITIFRFMNGILTFNLIPIVLFGMVGVGLGLILANKVIDKVDDQVIRKITYIMLGVSGVLNLF